MATLLNLSKTAAKNIYLCTTEKFYLSRKISLMIHINTIASSTITLRITLYVDDDMWLICGENLVVNFNAMFKHSHFTAFRLAFSTKSSCPKLTMFQ